MPPSAKVEPVEGKSYEENDAPAPWKASQVQATTSKIKKQMMIWSMMFFAFCDLLGTCLFVPAGAILCQRASGGPMDTYATLMRQYQFFGNMTKDDWLQHGITDQNFVELYAASSDETKANANISFVWQNMGMPKAFDNLPFSFSVATNVFLVGGSISSGIGAAMWGVVSDSVGRKPCMLICMLGGIAGYFIMYIGGTVAGSYWMFVGGNVVNGFFSGSYVLVNTFILDTFSKKEAETPIQTLQSISGLGAAAGSLLLMPFTQGNAENVFDAAWIGIIGTVVAFILVSYFVVEPRKQSFQEALQKQLTLKQQKKVDNTPILIKRIMWIAIVGSFLDAAGDEGTRIARGTILQVVFPSTNNINFQNILLLTTIALIMASLAMVSVLKKKLGDGLCIAIGSLFTCITQGLFLVNWQARTPP